MKRVYIPYAEQSQAFAPRGRVFEQDGALCFDWSASGFAFRFTGTACFLWFDAYEADMPAYIRLSVDGREVRHPIYGPRTVLGGDILSEGEHVVEVLRLSEGDVPLRLRQVELRGDSAEPHLLPPPPPKARRITFVGDSITCGFGCNAPISQDFFSWEEDACYAYAYLTAKELDADFQMVSISGQGLARAFNGERGILFSEYFTYRSRGKRTPYDYSEFVPHVVVVNGGTNDTGGKTPEEDFIRGAEALLDRIAEAYPDTPIVWFYGLMGTAWAPILTRLAEQKREAGIPLWFFPTAPISAEAEEVASKGHPSVRGQARGARELIAHLRALMEWND